jgi:hypothetical protein
LILRESNGCWPNEGVATNKSPFDTWTQSKDKKKPITTVGIVVLMPNTTITTVAMGLGASLGTAKSPHSAVAKGDALQNYQI